MSNHIDKTQPPVRRTQPKDTKKGLLQSYEEEKKYLVEGEAKGRLWIYEKAHRYLQDHPESLPPAPSDNDILELHRVMFSDLFEWAGQTRKIDVGPGGIVFVPYYHVPVELRYRFDNLKAQVSLRVRTYEDVNLDLASEIVAKAHHDFEYIHPFQDTNGRTGRVLDHYILWYTFGLIGPDFDSTPQITYFPDESYEKQYSKALKEADANNMLPLQEFYRERIENAFEALIEFTGPIE